MSADQHDPAPVLSTCEPATQTPAPTQERTPEALYWSGLSRALSPEQTLDNSAKSAKYLITTAALIMTISSGLGLSSDTIAAGLPRNTLIISACCAGLAVASCIWFLFPFSKPIRSRNLVEVQDWFENTMSRAWALPLAALAIIVQVACVPIAFLSNPTRSEPTFTLAYHPLLAQTKAQRGLASIAVECARCDTRAMKVELLGRINTGARAGDSVVLTSVLHNAPNGDISYASGEIPVGHFDQLVLEVNAQEVSVVSAK